MPPVVDEDGPAQEHAMADVVLFQTSYPDRPDLAIRVSETGPLTEDGRVHSLNEKSPEPPEKTPEATVPLETEVERKSPPASDLDDVEMRDAPGNNGNSVADSDSNDSTTMSSPRSTAPTIESPSYEKPSSIKKDFATDQSLVRQIRTANEATAQRSERLEIKQENAAGKSMMDSMGGLAVAEELLAISKGAARHSSVPPAIILPATDHLHPQSLHPTINTEHNHPLPKDKVQLPPISYALNSLAEMASVRSPFTGPTPSLAQPHSSIGGSKSTVYAAEAANRQPLHHISTQTQGITQQNSPPYLPQPLFQHRSPYQGNATAGSYPPPLAPPHSHMNTYTSELRNGTQLPTPTSPYYNTPNIERRESSTSTTTTYLDTPSGPSTGETYGSGSDDTIGASHASRVRASSKESQNGGFKCDFDGCKAAPFQTQYLLNSHANVHSQVRDHYCSEPGCPRGQGGRGFKRKNEMIRHGLVHASPGYACPYCPDREHKYPRPDNLQRHVKAHHPEKEKDDPVLRSVLARRPEGGTRGRRRRIGRNQSYTGS